VIWLNLFSVLLFPPPIARFFDWSIAYACSTLGLGVTAEESSLVGGCSVVTRCLAAEESLVLDCLVPAPAPLAAALSSSDSYIS
jgi:hypothetical protein